MTYVLSEPLPVHFNQRTVEKMVNIDTINSVGLWWYYIKTEPMTVP
jgi:hypothetical protein